MDKMREEFEGWLKATGQLAMVEDNGQYCFQHTRLAWDAWQASRNCLRVKLPTSWSVEQSDYKSEVVDELDGAGVSHE